MEMEIEHSQLSLPLEAPQEDWRAKVPSVSQLTRSLRGHIEGAFFDVWVKGEISTFRKPSSGHGYFTLKDSTSQLKAVMFRGALQKLKFQLQEGMEVLLHGNISVYEARGEYQIVCDTAEPVGQGALQAAFEQLKKKLQAEGLFSLDHKKPLPFLPKRIGLVTSATGAAVRDILKVLSRRYPDREVFLLPAAVQGEKAAPEIVSAIQLAEKWNAQESQRQIDVLIVGRGGGSLEDLWPFNEESVARALYRCSIPTISAVGHEIDFTISDFVADVRAPTPSAAAEMVIPRKDELLSRVDYQLSRLTTFTKKRIEQLRLHLGHLSQRLVSPKEKVRLIRDKVGTLESRTSVAMRNFLQHLRTRLENKILMLDSLSPLAVLGRGYSITKLPSGEIVRSVKQLKKGMKVSTQISDGSMTSEVLEISKS